ncbi:hypothetical protein B7P43_G06373 [Cryptotermes secundus]|nr:hypothetical protein B7P43_G06373 [Cryptotermes secundus]
MLKVLETAYLEMLSTFYSLPKCCGLMLRKEVNMTVLQIMESLTTVVLSLQEKGDKAQKNRLMLTGRVWDACEAVESLPQNNFQVTCKIMQREEGLVLDAVQEIEEEVAADQSDNNKTWNHKDRELLFPCIGLVKAARSSLKRTDTALRMKGKSETEQQVSQLDDLVSGVKKISPAVDDLISSLYPPMNKDAVRSTAAVLKTQIQALLHMVKQSHYTNEEDNSWIEFLLNAVDHNNNKLQPLLVS